MTINQNQKIKSPTVYIVHAIDTEGPLYESFASHFERVKEIFGIDIEPTKENLEKLRNKKFDLSGNEERASQMMSKIRINTHKSWDQIDDMLDIITTKKYRHKIKDSFGNGWIYNWFCMDHVGITGNNPRRRDMGYHNIFDHYKEYFKFKNDINDSIHWHYHPLSLTNDANRAGSTYLNSGHIYNIISRRIIDRNWFPVCFRAGHHVERPDANFFLEQWVPFDFSNDAGLVVRANKSKARFGDWRNAPNSWLPYNPDHDNYKIRGSCRRYICKCLPIKERGYTITTSDIENAFDEAQKNGQSILSFTNHDFRNMNPDIEYVRNLIKDCSKKFHKINFKYSTAIEAMRGVLGVFKPDVINLSLELLKKKTNNCLFIKSQNKIFGPQPYLALKLKDGSYHWQNFDFEDDNLWSYSFDNDNVLIDQVETIGVAANNIHGVTEIIILDVKTGKKKKTVLNI